MKPYMVDCIMEPSQWDLSLKDTITRIVQPMIATLKRDAEPPGPEDVMLHMRLWIAPLAQWQLGLYDTNNEDDDK